MAEESFGDSTSSHRVDRDGLQEWLEEQLDRYEDAPVGYSFAVKKLPHGDHVTTTIETDHQIIPRSGGPAE